MLLRLAATLLLTLAAAACTADNPDYEADGEVLPTPDLSGEIPDFALPVDLTTRPPIDLRRADLRSADQAVGTADMSGDMSIVEIWDATSPFDLINATCGVISKPCCNGVCLDPGTICQNNVCQQCGVVGRLCCANQGCSSGQTCVNGVCELCGHVGEFCCGGQMCGMGQTCVAGLCQRCGTIGLICCANNQCGIGTACLRGFCQQCGGQGQPCCANNPCPNSQTMKCVNGRCA